MSPIRVAITLEQCWHRVPGGTACSILDLVDAIELGHPDVELIGVAARHREQPPVEFAPSIDVRKLPLPRALLYETWHVLRWPDVEAASGPVDVAHATTIAIPGTRAPLVVTIHDLAFLHEPEHFTRRGLRLFDRGLKLALRHAAIVVCPSEASADDCRSVGFRDDRLRVVPWGVVPVEVDAGEQARVLAHHGLDRPYVLFTGTIEPRKNLAGVLGAFGRLDRPDLDLVVVGPDGWNEDLAALVDRTGVPIRRLGFVAGDELPALYAGAAAFCAPSLREGFGLPVLEAMSQGTPVVTSAGTSTAEIVGDSGVLVDPTDVDAIAAGLARALDEPTLGPAGRVRAAGFTMAATAAGYVAAYGDAREGQPVTARIGINALFVQPGIVGGTENYVSRLLGGLAEQPTDDLDLVVYATRSFLTAHPTIASSHRVVSAPLADPSRVARVALEHVWLGRQARRDRVAAVHHLGGTMPAFGSRPGILTVHDVQPLVHPERFPPVKRRYLARLFPRSVRAAQRVVAVSEFTRDQLIEHLEVDPGRIDVVTAGLDLAPHEVHETDVLRRLDLTGRPFVLYPTITYAFKRHAFLVEVFARVVETHPDVVLVLTGGEADAETELRHTISSLGLSDRVRRPGRVSDDDVETLYRHAAVLAFPSSYEGFGLPVLEAMARGVPVVATDDTAIPEVVGDAGVLVAPDDERAWTRAISALLGDPVRRHDLADKGRARAAEFNWSASAQAQLAVYRKIVEQVGS